MLKCTNYIIEILQCSSETIPLFEAMIMNSYRITFQTSPLCGLSANSTSICCRQWASVVIHTIKPNFLWNTLICREDSTTRTTDFLMV